MFPSPGISEEAYAARLQQGSEPAFRFVMEQYFLMITLFADRIVRNRAAAEDIATETFITLWKHFDPTRSFSSVKAFLFLTAKNAALNHLRQHWRQQERDHVFIESIPNNEGITGAIVRSEVKAQIIQAYNALPEKMKQIFELAFLEGLPNRDIARQLDLSVNTVKAQKARAIELLREYFRENGMLSLAFLLSALLDAYIILTS